MSTSIPDRPVTEWTEERLGRAPFVESVAEIIKTSPSGGSLRIGIYGDWGSGKSSVMRLLQSTLQKAGHACPWLAPWSAESREDVSRLLLTGILRELGIDDSDYRKANSRATVIAALRGAAAATSYTQALEGFAGDWVANKAKNDVTAKERQLSLSISRALGHRKMIVFVDDLDRVRPDLLPNLLMTLREVLDKPNYYYVLGLAPNIVERGLALNNAAWGEAGAFLEKIVELALHLPDASSAASLTYASHLISRLDERVPVDHIKSLRDVLPRNPRQLKLYVRWISSLAPLLNRFDKDELALSPFLLLQLLRVLYPLNSERLVADEESTTAVESAQWNRAVERVSRSDVQNAAQIREEEKFAPNEAGRRQHFLAICEALRHSSEFVLSEALLPVLYRLPEDPPLYTMRELRSAIAQTQGQDLTVARQQLRTLLGAKGESDRDRLSSLWFVTVRVRQGYLEAAASSEFEDQVTSALASAHECTRLLSLLIEQTSLFSTDDASRDDFLTLYDHASKWAPFNRLSYYETTRDEERALLMQATEQLTPAAAAALYDSNVFRNAGGARTKSAAFDASASAIGERISLLTSDWLLALFETPDALTAMWKFDSNRWGKDLLFDPASALYSGERRDRFLGLTLRALRDRTIAGNFLTYVRMTIYGATEGGRMPREECERLVKDHHMMQSAWKAALAFPLNPRVAGSLREQYGLLLAKGVPADVLPLPEWWRILDQEFFDSPTDGAKSADRSQDTADGSTDE